MRLYMYSVFSTQQNKTKILANKDFGNFAFNTHTQILCPYNYSIFIHINI